MKFCSQYPPSLSTLFYDGTDAYTINGTIPIGSVLTAYCKEGYYRQPNNIQVSGKCAASGNLDGNYQQCVCKYK